MLAIWQRLDIGLCRRAVLRGGPLSAERRCLHEALYLVYALRHPGASYADIGRLVGISKQAVEKIIQAVEGRRDGDGALNARIGAVLRIHAALCEGVFDGPSR